MVEDKADRKSSQEQKEKKILIIDIDKDWQEELKSILIHHSACKIKILDSFEEAERFIFSNGRLDYDLAIININLRKKIFDNGGLSILNSIKAIKEQLPALILCNDPHNYPGIRKITKRYQDVLVYTREVFRGESTKILNRLFIELPPQIHDIDVQAQFDINYLSNGYHGKNRGLSLREFIRGTIAVLFILIAAYFTFQLIEMHANYPLETRIVFVLVILAVIMALLKAYKTKIFLKAIEIYKDLFTRNGAAIGNTNPKKKSLEGEDD